MSRTHLSTLLATLLALTVIIGCGGGGGGGGGNSTSGSGSSGSTTGGTPNGTIFSQQIVGTASGSTVPRSPANFVVGDKLTLRSLALYLDETATDPAQRYQGGHYEAVSNVVLTADPSVATLGGTVLTAHGVGTGTIALTGANGQVLGPVTFTISDGLASVAGRVRTVQVNDVEPGVATISVKFLDASGATVATTVTGPDGRFQANVPTTARLFVADLSSLPNSFYNQFTYGALDYTAETAGCGVALGTLSASSNVGLDDAIVYRRGGSNPPPPPGSGCVGS